MKKFIKYFVVYEVAAYAINNASYKSAEQQNQKLYEQWRLKNEPIPQRTGLPQEQQQPFETKKPFELPSVLTSFIKGVFGR